MPERHNSKPCIVKVLAHLDRTPPVECDLMDIETLTERFDMAFDMTVVDNIAFGSL